jgi:hypothetical protein
MMTMSSDTIRQAFLKGSGRWTGCDWPTRFGALGLNLCRLTAWQAALMARATAGAEADDWWGAARWLAAVEADARQAEEAARRAAHLAGAGRLAEATEQAQTACELEGRYRAVVVWRPLHDAIREVVSV